MAGKSGLPILLATPLLLHGQSDDPGRFTAKLLQSRYSISVRSGQFSGTGSPVLKSAIAQSRFILVGETHGLAETARFGSAVCKAAGPERFHAMAIEEGPLAAAELERWAREPNGKTQLAEFEKQYPESLNIYGSLEEFEMLQQCAAAAQSGKFQLWGVNQEMLGAGGFMLRRILDTQPSGESARAIRQLLQRNDEATAKALQTGKISDLFMISADDQQLASTAALLQHGGDPRARQLFASLIESHEINRAWPRDAARRFRLMKSLFATDYAELSRSASSPPKVLLKFGAFHIYRGWNPMHASGIGNYIAEFAEAHGAQSLHICVMAVKSSEHRFSGVGRPPGELRTFDLKDDPRSRYLQPLISNLLEPDWTIFDLRPLRQFVNERPGIINSDLTALIFGIDMLVMIPEATPSTPIR